MMCEPQHSNWWRHNYVRLNSPGVTERVSRVTEGLRLQIPKSLPDNIISENAKKYIYIRKTPNIYTFSDSADSYLFENKHHLSQERDTVQLLELNWRRYDVILRHV